LGHFKRILKRKILGRAFRSGLMIFGHRCSSHNHKSDQDGIPPHRLEFTMPIALAPREPMLLRKEHRIPSAEMQTSQVKSKFSTSTSIAVAKKTVSFYEIVSIRSTIHCNDMTDEEVFGSWYSRREMMAIKKSMSTEIKCMTDGRPFPDEGTTRGLEFRTREGSDRRKANKLNSIHAVLDEQDVQQMRGICDPEGLRRAYLEHSRRCLAESQVLAKADEIEVQLMRKTEERELMDIDQDDYFPR
jgi:hypothetical protein